MDIGHSSSTNSTVQANPFKCPALSSLKYNCHLGMRSMFCFLFSVECLNFGIIGTNIIILVSGGFHWCKHFDNCYYKHLHVIRRLKQALSMM